jgi:hypothetical protein
MESSVDWYGSKFCSREAKLGVRTSILRISSQPARSSTVTWDNFIQLASKFRRGRLIQHLEFAQLLDECRATKLQETRGMRDRTASAIQSLLD